MHDYKDDAFADRLSAAANAKRAAQEKFRARNGAADPAAVGDQTTRPTIGVTGEECLAKREVLLGESG